MAKCKTPGRRKPRRAPPRPQRQPLDSDLVELASVIAEFQLDNNVHGWFRPAWRDGWNAVGLAHAAWLRLSCLPMHIDAFERAVAAYIENTLVRHRTRSAEAYLRATEDIEVLLRYGSKRGGLMLAAALRCYQVLVADSSGGGVVYNDVLKRAFEGIEDAGISIEDVAAIVMEWRCRDAIGTTAQLQQDANDRLRRAFTTAWQRGLYLAAYSLPPAVDYSKKPTIVKG